MYIHGKGKPVSHYFLALLYFVFVCFVFFFFFASFNLFFVHLLLGGVVATGNSL